MQILVHGKDILILVLHLFLLIIFIIIEYDGLCLFRLIDRNMIMPVHTAPSAIIFCLCIAVPFIQQRIVIAAAEQRQTLEIG